MPPAGGGRGLGQDGCAYRAQGSSRAEAWSGENGGKLGHRPTREASSSCSPLAGPAHTRMGAPALNRVRVVFISSFLSFNTQDRTNLRVINTGTCLGISVNARTPNGVIFESR